MVRTGVAALVMGLAWFWLMRTIGHPIMRRTTAMKGLAAGDGAVTVPAEGRRDEVAGESWEAF